MAKSFSFFFKQRIILEKSDSVQTLSVQTLLRCPYCPRVQSHASTPARTLKIPSTGSCIPLSGHTKMLHSLVGMGSAALAAAAALPR